MILLTRSGELVRDQYRIVDEANNCIASANEYMCVLFIERSRVKDFLYQLSLDKDIAAEVLEYIGWGVDFYIDRVREDIEIMSLKAPLNKKDLLEITYLVLKRSLHIIIFPEELSEENIRKIIEALRLSLSKRKRDLVNYFIEEVISLYNDTVTFLEDLVEEYEDDIWRSETLIMKNENAKRIYSTKRLLIELERSLLRLRDLLVAIEHNEYFKGSINYTGLYYNRLEISSLIETIGVLRDLLITLIDINIAAASYKINDIMKKLTAISLILMPPTLIASIYGMNFDTSVSPWNMPELKHPFGYIIALTMILLAMWLPYLILKRTKFL